MPRHRENFPSYRLHKQSGQAVVTLTDPSGVRRDVLLGTHGTTESRAEYDRVVGEWVANGRRLTPAAGDRSSGGDGLAVNELLLAYWHHAQSYYVKDGTQTDQIARVKLALRPVREWYGHTPATAFGPKALKAIREKWVRDGHARGYVNALTGCVKRVWKWAVAEELVPPATYQGLSTIEGLKKGRTEAREPEPVGPVPTADVEATLPELTPTLRAMVRLQLLTGMRPGEVILVRPCDVDRSAAVWVYRPESHKTEHHDAVRAVFIGPQGQEVLQPFLADRSADAYCFSPKESMAQHRAKQRKARQTKVQPSQICRKKAKPRRQPGDCYSVDTYGNAVERACKRSGVEPWSVNQLRHTKATLVRKQYGLEAAQVLLGHSRADVTQVYAERDHGLAAKVAAELG